MGMFLKDGLILRTLRESPLEDRQKLAEFYRNTFHEIPDLSGEQLLNWTLDLMADTHPTTSLDDFWLVVDPHRENAIVSALMLIPQMWRYEDVEIPVGRIELVATHPEYRRRGLVSVQMDAAHERSAALGHVLQGITGISHYYRRFGYAFTVLLGSGMAVNFSSISPLKPDEKPSYTLRPAVDADVPLMVKWDRAYAEQCLLSTVRTEAMWRYELSERNQNTPPALYTYMIVDQQGESVGYVAYVVSEPFTYASVVGYNTGEKASILVTFNDVMRAVDQQLQERSRGKEKSFERLGFDVGCHPTIEALIQRTSSGVVSKTPHAWYLRVPDLPIFMEKIKPVLERRLHGSGANNYTGELKISFYDFTGIVMQFEDGQLTAVAYQDILPQEAHAQFPYHSFLNIVFGHHHVDELRYILPEVSANREAAILLGILFPKKRSWLMAQA